MFDLKSIAAGATLAGALGLAALGIGAGVATAAPPGIDFPQKPHWDPGPGPWHGPGWKGVPIWYPPPPPNYGYGYGPSACVQGPLGYVRVCI